MKAILANIDFSDVLIFLGCILTGYGLFLLKGVGFAITFIGAVLLILGILGAIPAKKPCKGK